MPTRVRRSLLLTLVGLLVWGAAVLPLWAQSSPEVRIRGAELEADGTTRLVVSVTGTEGGAVLERSVFSVTEGGHAIEDPSVEPLLEAGQAPPVAVSLVIDVSGSTEGEPLERAKAAAIAFAERLTADGVQVEVIAFGDVPNVVAPLSTDARSLTGYIAGLEAAGETALYDAIVLAAQRLDAFEGQPNVVVFSDGGDTVSDTDVDAAVASALAVDAPVTTVALTTPELDLAALESVAAGTGGRTVPVAEAEQLAGAFESVATHIASQYVITYRASTLEPAELDVTVSVSAGGVSGADTVTVMNGRVAPEVAGPLPFADAQPARPPVPVLASRAGLYLGVIAAFVTALLLLTTGLVSVRSSAAERSLKRTLRFYSTSAGRDEDMRAGPRPVSERVADLVDRVPKPQGFDDRLQGQLDRAGWPVRTGEFLWFQMLAGAGSALAAWAVSTNLIFAVLAGLVGAFVPRMVLLSKIEKRASAFLEQLPDTLQLLSGSLKAGYGLLQAIDTVVKEVDEPASSEFARVLTEARLGMPLEDALGAMADRMDSEDFRWVVMAINIQKQVGGNLARLLEVVASTLREREQVRRQIKVLSAEGRLSAVVLIVLPFLLAGYMALVNPQYIGDLFTHRVGLMMVVGAVTFMTIGVAWIRKLITIEV